VSKEVPGLSGVAVLPFGFTIFYLDPGCIIYLFIRACTYLHMFRLTLCLNAHSSSGWSLAQTLFCACCYQN